MGKPESASDPTAPGGWKSQGCEEIVLLFLSFSQSFSCEEFQSATPGFPGACTGPSTMSIWAGIPHQPLWQGSPRHLAHATGTSSRVVQAQPAVSFLCSSVLAVPQQPPRGSEGQDPA